MKRESRGGPAKPASPQKSDPAPEPAGADASSIASASGVPLPGSAGRAFVAWFLSRTVRRATDMTRHVRKLVNHQRDLLEPKAIAAVNAARDDLRGAIRSGADKTTLRQGMTALEEAANKWLKAYPHAGVRENVEVFLVAVAVAMGIRTFFLQPFKIPTGSMQPTLYGITHENLKDKPDFTIPTGLKKFYDRWVHGNAYFHLVARNDGELVVPGPPRSLLPFVKRQDLLIGGQRYTIWFPPDRLFDRAGVFEGQYFRAGQDIVRLRVKSGDHLFVDRLTYNFRPPQRGELIVFKTEGIAHPNIPQDVFYIKRLVALGGDKVQIGNDQHLIINGERLDASTPHFENVYTFQPEPRENHYFGHVNETVGRRLGKPRLADNFPEEKAVFPVRTNHYLVMGDNTLNSFDSRAWGDFSRTNVIGKSSFVYWPISERFGWGHR